MDLDKLSDDELLRLRFSELGLEIEGTPVEEGIIQLYHELAAKGFIFRPSCYLADEWLSPDGEPIIGIPFYLAHPRLRKLEHKMMLEVEGGDRNSLIRLLRHEAGHAVNYAYLLYKKGKWKKLFGSFDKDYPEKYKYRPYSKRFVRHLEGWYAQYHPDEDFAETFAVWLDPDSDWKERYKGWGAIEKLNYVDRLMLKIVPTFPKKKEGKKYWDISQMDTTLKRHYEKRQKLYAEDYPEFHDLNLKKIFLGSFEHKQTLKAHRLIAHHQKELLSDVALWTGEKRFIINSLLKDLIERAKQLNLETGPDEKGAVRKIAVYVTAQIMNYLYTGRYRGKR